MSPIARALTGGAILAGGCVAWGAVFERTWYVLRHETIPLLRPPASGPLRVLHLSDLHLLPGQRRLRSFLASCRATGPDLVVTTGDLIGSPETIDEAVALLADVRGDRPGLTVLGSNDRYAPRPRSPLAYFVSPAKRPHSRLLDTERLVEGLRASGWEVIDNRRTCVHAPVGEIDVIGLGDPHIGRDRPEYVDWTPPGGSSMSRDPSLPGPVALRLGVVHAPYTRVLDTYARAGFDLVLAGHTHGGQVRLPGVGALVNNCDLPRGQTRGLSRHGRTWLNVSAGLGHSRYAPYRFACRPEATVLDLVPAR